MSGRRAGLAAGPCPLLAGPSAAGTEGPRRPVLALARQAHAARAAALAAGPGMARHLADAEAIRLANLTAAMPAADLAGVMAKLGVLVIELAGEAESGTDDVAAMRLGLAATALADLAVLGAPQLAGASEGAAA